jgi:hypothetical protein
MAAYHLLSLSLLTRLHAGDEHVAHDLLSNVTFNVDFLRYETDVCCLSSAIDEVGLPVYTIPVITCQSRNYQLII